MKVKDLGEFGLIDRIRRFPVSSIQCPVSSVIGIGDDAAVIPISRSKCLLWTTDILIEGIHFLLKYPLLSAFSFQLSAAFMLGWKAMAVNLSDIASMGGKPKYALVTLGLTGKEDVRSIDDLYRGMNAVGQGLSQIYRPDGHRGVESGLSHCSKGVQVLGGDISKSRSLLIDTTVIGEVEMKNLLLRKGARPGDMICVTGSCGDSAAGLELLKNSVQCPARPAQRQGEVSPRWPSGRMSSVQQYLIKRHLMPVPRVREARIIATNKFASSMIDSSDGLLASVGFICQESGTGAEIYENKIPVSLQLSTIISSPLEGEEKGEGSKKRWGLKLTLTGGEDYELVFTVPPAKLKKVLAAVPRLTGTPVTAVGEITKNKRLYVIDGKGKKRVAGNLGFSHF